MFQGKDESKQPRRPWWRGGAQPSPDGEWGRPGGPPAVITDSSGQNPTARAAVAAGAAGVARSTRPQADLTASATRDSTQANAPTIVRNNNPGALEDGNFARNQPGYVQGGGRFARFATPEDGIRAQETLLRRNYRGLSIDRVVDRYTPRSNENSEEGRENYKNYIAAQLGIGRNVPVPDSMIPQLAAAQRNWETGAANGGGVTGSDGAPMDSPPSVPRVDVTTIQPTPGEEAAMGQNQYDLQDPFGMSAIIRPIQDQVNTRGRMVDDALTGAITRVDEIQEHREDQLAATIAVKQQINDQIGQATTQLITEAQPLFQSREAIRARRRGLTEMNPLERAIRGAFDPNYNDADLEARDRMLQGELTGLAEEHQYITTLQNRLVELAQSSLVDRDALSVLEMTNTLQDVELITRSFDVSRSILSASMGGLENQMAIVGAQHTARTLTLTQMSVGQINQAIESAERSGTGTAIVNGIPIGVGQLRERQQNFQAVQDALESRGLALAANRMDLADRYQSRIIERMSAEEIDMAIQNGGEYQGQSLSVVALTQALGPARARQEDQARNMAAGSALGQVATQLRQGLAYIEQDSARATSLFGNLPPQLAAVNNQLAGQMQTFITELQEAEARGIGRQYLEVNGQRMQAIMDARDTAITNFVQSWAGGDNEIAAVAGSWIRGQPISGEVAINGLIRMGRSGMPAGINLTGAPRAVFDQVRAAVQQYYSSRGANGRPVNQNEIPASLREQVQRITQTGYNNHLTEEIVRSTVALASRVNGPDNTPHPFVAVGQERFGQAMAYATRSANERMATSLGINADQMETLLNGGTRSDLWQQVKTRKGWTDEQFAVVARQTLAMETMALFDALDSGGNLPNGQTPSRAFVNLMTDPRYQSQISQLTRAAAQGNFGNFLTSAGAGGGFDQQFLAYADSVNRAYAQRDAGNMRARITGMQNFANRFADPWQRVDFVLGAVNDISAQERRTLIDAVRGRIPRPQVAGVMGSVQSQTDLNEQIRDIIRNQRFDDAGLESIRRRAAAAWEASEIVIGRLETVLNEQKA